MDKEPISLAQLLQGQRLSAFSKIDQITSNPLYEEALLSAFKAQVNSHLIKNPNYINNDILPIIKVTYNQKIQFSVKDLHLLFGHFGTIVRVVL